MSIDTTIPRSARSAGRRVRRVAAAVPAAGLLSAPFGEHADAALEGEHYHDSGSELLTDFCGLDVQHDWEVAGSWTGVAKGPDGLVHYRERAHGSNAFTNVATGKTYSTQWTSNSRDLKLTDNGDGTTTVLIQASGGERWFAND